MLETLQKILDFELTVLDWIILALVVGLPYLAVGFLWWVHRYDQFAGLSGVSLAAAIVGAVVSWPVLMVSTTCAPPA